MEHLIIRGGRPLCGTVTINGAKNAVLPILAATVLKSGTYAIHNCPDISDVTLASEILHALGGSVIRSGRLLLVDTSGIDRWTIPGELMCRMRASILFLGPLLARFGQAELTMPGGCPLGRRPIDLHLEAITRMGASVTLQDDRIICEASSLRGGDICFPFPSVGATENALLAATACRGITTIKHAAQEPEIADLIGFLQTMGAEISGAGTDLLAVKGGAPLSDSAYGVMPDRIETATYLCAVAACGGDVTLRCAKADHQCPVLEALCRAGCIICGTPDGLRIVSNGTLSGIGEIATAPWPGFPTDAQALLMSALLRAEGESRFVETVFEGRMGHVPQLRRFGGQIETVGSTALVRGVRKLYGAQADAGDLRAAAALVIAALQAPEESVITGINHLHRGYDNLEEQLSGLGAWIRK